MRTLRWSWPILLVVVAAATAAFLYGARPTTELGLVVLDKTVPFQNRLEHRSLFWLLDHLRYRTPDGARFDAADDYLGAIPGPESGDPPAETRPLLARHLGPLTRMLYIADTYGVYEGDLESRTMRAALERSPKVYGGLRPDEASLAAAFVRRGGLLVAEFNAFASPTPPEARRTMESTLGVRWTRWVGRYFADLASVEEIPQWMRDNYREIHMREWTFEGAGWVLLRDDEAIEVLRVGEEVARRGLTIEHTHPGHPWTRGVSDGVAYPYWFDIVEADEGTDTLLSYRWHATPRGKAILVRHGLPVVFPAVTHRAGSDESPYGPPGDSRGDAVYFAGDFADNPLPTTRVPLAGYTAFRRGGEGYKWAPSGTAFFWRVYVPMMQNLLRDAAG